MGDTECGTSPAADGFASTEKIFPSTGSSSLIQKTVWSGVPRETSPSTSPGTTSTDSVALGSSVMKPVIACITRYVANHLRPIALGTPNPATATIGSGRTRTLASTSVLTTTTAAQACTQRHSNSAAVPTVSIMATNSGAMDLRLPYGTTNEHRRRALPTRVARVMERVRRGKPEWH